MSTTARSTRYAATAAAVLLMTGAGAAGADPATPASGQAPGQAEPYADAQHVEIGSPWGLGPVSLRYGNGPVCAGGANGNAPVEEIHITFVEEHGSDPAFSLNPIFSLPSTLTTDVQWRNEDTGATGTDHFSGYRYDGFARIRPGAGTVTGTVTATASLLPGGGSVDGLGSHTVTLPFTTEVPACT